MLIARTSKAAARLSEQFRSGSIAKVYWAIVKGARARVGHMDRCRHKGQPANRAYAQETRT